MSEPARDRWLSIGLSVLLHGTVIGLLVYGWWHFRQPAPAPTLPIQATVVDARTLKGMGIASTPAPKQVKPPPVTTPPPAAASPPPAPAPIPQGPPQPTPQELAMRAQAARQEAEHQAAAERELQARQKAEAEQRAQAEAAATAKAKKRAEEKKLAEQKKRAEARKRAEQKLAAARAARQRAQRIAQLQQSLNEDAQQAAARGELASWQAEITSRIQNAWIRPPTARPGIECVLDVTQVQGGAVTNVTIGRCNGDEAVRESIEAAVYRASPLPPPPDPSLFQRELIIKFKPTD